MIQALGCFRGLCKFVLRKTKRKKKIIEVNLLNCFLISLGCPDYVSNGKREQRDTSVFPEVKQ